MAILSVLGSVPEEVQPNQPSTAATELDDSDVPVECRLYRRSLDDKPAEWRDDDCDDHNEYVHLLRRLYVYGLRAMRPA